MGLILCFLLTQNSHWCPWESKEHKESINGPLYFGIWSHNSLSDHNKNDLWDVITNNLEIYAQFSNTQGKKIEKTSDTLFRVHVDRFSMGRISFLTIAEMSFS